MKLNFFNTDKKAIARQKIRQGMELSKTNNERPTISFKKSTILGT